MYVMPCKNLRRPDISQTDWEENKLRFFHLSDLHIGRQLHGYSLYDEQKHILHEIVMLAEEHRPDAVVIAGDIFDKSVPSGDAYTLFDDFLNQLADITPAIPVLIIAGNHDSEQRLQYASSFLAKNHIYIEAFPPMKCGEGIRRITLEDAFGEVDFYLLPFTRPEHVRARMEEEEPDQPRRPGGMTCEQAVQFLLNREDMSEKKRRVLISHQFYCSGSQEPDGCDSEQVRLSVGGIDRIDTAVLEPFTYAALGHIHGAQRVGRESVRYCGTPLKYSVSEEHHRKSVTVVTLGNVGEEPVIETLELTPLWQVRSIRGRLEDVVAQAQEPSCHDYVSITLTDDLEQFHARDRLLEVYDHILEIRIDNERTRAMLYDNAQPEEEQTVEEAFAGFYQEMHGHAMSEAESEIMNEIFAEIEGGAGR